MKSHIFSISFLLVLLVGIFFACTAEESTIPNTKVIVTGVSLNKITLDLKVGDKEMLIPTIAPNKAPDKSITWTSSKTTVATVSKTGEVTAIGLGRTTITVTTTDGNKTATVEISVTSSGTTVPASPAIASATIKEGTDSTVVLRWTPPVDTGKGVDGVSVAPITGYEITFSPAVSSITQPIVLGAAVISKELILTPGNTYIFTVKAKNTKGLSPGKTTQISMVSVLSVPGSPTNLASASGITQVFIPLTWAAPSNKGKNTDGSESDIKDYTISYTPTGGSAQTKIVTSAGTTLTGLTPGTAYTITVRATNMANLESEPSTSITSSTLSAATKPTAPTNLKATTSGITQVSISLTWTAPSDKGKNPNNTTASLTKYTITYTTGGITLTKVVASTGGLAPALSTILTGLAFGTTYSITVKAVNTAGETSGSSNVFTTTTSVPLPKDGLGALVYGISQNTSKTLPTQTEIDEVNSAKIIFSGLNASTSATVHLRYVKTDGVDTNDGTSWTKAKIGIKATLDAITDASANKIYLLLIGAGTYTPTTWVSMKNHVAIIGGFKASSNPIDSYDKANEASTISGGNAKQVFKNYSLDARNNVKSTAVLARVTVTKGKAMGNTKGGAMYNTNSSPTITEVTFSNNASSKGGGAMYNYNSSPIITQVTFSRNNASLDGGGMFNNATSSPIVTQVTFSGNSATKYGGGMYNSNSSPIVTQVTFSGNSASLGGGFYNSAGTPVISSTIFWGNTKNDKTTSNQIINDSGIPILAHCIIQDYTITANSIVTTDPGLGVLANNGGSVKTTAIGTTSSAKDKGLYFARKGRVIYYSSDNATWYTTPLLTGTSVTLPSDALKYTTDARGYGYSGRPDMGAYENSGTAPQ